MLTGDDIAPASIFQASVEANTATACKSSLRGDTGGLMAELSGGVLQQPHRLTPATASQQGTAAHAQESDVGLAVAQQLRAFPSDSPPEQQVAAVSPSQQPSTPLQQAVGGAANTTPNNTASKAENGRASLRKRFTAA